MTRMYAKVWEQIKKSGSVTVEVEHASRIRSICNMIVKEKYLDEKLRKELGLRPHGKLDIERMPEQKQIRFRLVRPLSLEQL